MKLMAFKRFAIALIVAIPAIAYSQTTTNTELLRSAAAQQAAKEKAMQQRLSTLAKQKGWDMVMRGPKGKIAILVGVDQMGYPEYLVTDNNVTAAATIGTNKLWPGGVTGLNLNGSSNSVRGKLGVWDGGAVRSSHVELTGRILQKDNAAGLSDHATHVAGTLIASGVNPLAKGMSFGQQQLWAYDFGNDNSEMLADAASLLVSNHSYGEIAGWYYNDAVNPARWEFRGRFNENEDYKMGYYNGKSELWDSIAYNAPYYLIVKSAGNKRNENGPAVGQPYWRYDVNGVMSSAGTRPDGINSNDGYDIIPSNGVAKNVLTIGAVGMIPNGYTRPTDVIMSSFSSYGPTDDGRIKPDVSAAGVNLMSSVGNSDNAYDTYSGTSMSSPNTSGSLLLLQEYYAQLHAGTFMRSATLKGLVIHTADEAGDTPGPDYRFGWGLINMQSAATAITSNNTKHLIQENVLNSGNTFTQNVVATGEGKLFATISWTDPKGPVEPLVTALNNPTKRLVHDLDIVIKKGATTYQPWVLNPVIPAAAASKGNNNTDNVEQVVIEDVVPGETYTIEITNKGTLQRGSQAYSLLVSGVGGSAICASNPTSTAGARIDSVAFANIFNKNATNCTGYSNYTNLTANVQPGQTLAFFARLNSCDASNADKILKVFIDANNDGDFTDAGETLATSAVINGNGDFTGNITIPSTLAVGNFTIMRMVMQETNSAAAVTPCGTYAKGETQDYRVAIVLPSIDASIGALVSPSSGDCRNTGSYATVMIRNNGSLMMKDVPLTIEIKQGSNIIGTYNEVFADTILAGGTVEHTFQTPFALAPNTTYTFTASAGLSGDMVPGNNQLISSITTAGTPDPPTGTANICAGNARLNATSSASNGAFSWYISSSAPTPIATGASAITNNLQSTYYLSSGEYQNNTGAPNKLAFVDGSYNRFGPAILFTAQTACVIKSARMYIGHSGNIRFFLGVPANINESTGAYSYYPVSSKVYQVLASAPTAPTLGQQMNNPADLGRVYTLDIVVPGPGNYLIGIAYEDSASIYRNNNIATTNYPYTVPGLLTITGNTARQTGNPNYFQSFYYYMYDINVKPLTGCPSERTAIVATTSAAPVITNNGNVLSSNFVDGNQWFLNGVAINGATGQNHTATASGTYRVERGDATGCVLESNTIVITLTPVTDVNGVEIGLTASPNPTTGPFNLQLETRTKADLIISLVNSIGQEVYTQTIPNFIGKLSRDINPGPLAPGVYYLKIRHNKKAYSKKIVIVQ